MHLSKYPAHYAAHYEAVFITTHQNVPFTFVDSDAYRRARAKAANRNQDLWVRLWGQKKHIIPKYLIFIVI